MFVITKIMFRFNYLYFGSVVDVLIVIRLFIIIVGIFYVNVVRIGDRFNGFCFALKLSCFDVIIVSWHGVL